MYPVVTDTDRTFAPDTLNGWKEIASYLGKSVRSVQRWERELFLPIHRIATREGGQIVYTTRAEIDSWRAGLDASSEQQVQGKSTNGADGSEGLEASLAPRHPRLLTWMASLAAALIAGAVVGYTFLPRFGGAPAQFEFDGEQLIALTDGGRIVWRYAFGRSVVRPFSNQNMLFTPVRTALGDVDGDGSDDAVVSVRYGSRDKTDETDAVFAFRRDGTIIWKVQPTLQVDDENQTFTAPWHLRDVFISPQSGPKQVWLAYVHNTWRPSFVVRVAPDGRQTVVYLQSGWIYRLAHFQTPTQAYLAVGGNMNEYHRASLALLGVDDPPSHSVQVSEPHLRCSACTAAGAPRAFYLFPESEVGRELVPPSAWTRMFRQLGDNLKVNIEEGFDGGSLATVAPTLDVIDYERSDKYWELHRRLENQRRISHSVDQCPELRSPKDISVWTRGSGWTQQRVAPSTPAPGKTDPHALSAAGASR